MRAYRTFQALVLAGLGFFILERVWSGQVLFYINSRSVWIVLIAGVVLVGLAQIVFQARLAHPQTEAESPEHTHARPGLGNLFLLLIPLLVGLLVPTRPLSTGVLANRGNPFHSRFDAFEPERRHQRADRPSRRLDLAPAIARGELWMIEKLDHVVHAGVGNLRRIEPRDDVG